MFNIRVTMWAHTSITDRDSVPDSHVMTLGCGGLGWTTITAVCRLYLHFLYTQELCHLLFVTGEVNVHEVFL